MKGEPEKHFEGGFGFKFGGCFALNVFPNSHVPIVTCTAFPYVTLHSQPFPIIRLVAVLCYTCYFALVL